MDHAVMTAEIRRLAAAQLRVPLDQLEVTVAPSFVDRECHAEVHASGSPTPVRAAGRTPGAALAALLHGLRARASSARARPARPLVMTPELERAIALLQLSRRELIESIREEMVANPSPGRD